MSALVAIPALSSATYIPGPAGKVVFASGRASLGIPNPSVSDADARLWVADYPSGTPAQVTTLPANTQHRHPNWSPDHTRIVYAAGVAFSGTYALWIVDLRTGSQTEFVPAAEKQDRPSWSPDGTKIAYGAKGDLWVKDVAPGSVAVQLTKTAGLIEERPVWSHDGKTLYYNQGEAGNRDIYSFSPVDPTGGKTPIVTEPDDNWQPALSPDGNRLCFLRGPQSDGADLYTAPVDGSSGASELSKEVGKGELNCVWAPDGSKVLFTRGAFGAGDIYTRNPNGTNLTQLSAYNVAEHFDGNADWATNFSPECDPVNTQVGVNAFTTIQLSCTDPDDGSGKAPPTPTALEGLEIVSPPMNGTIGGVSDQETVIYTPKTNFTGTDAFAYTGSDNVSDAPPATVTIQVGNPSAGTPDIGGDRTAPRISGVSVSPKRWRRGKALARISRAALGTTISFRLSEAARANFSFQRAQPGRQVGRRCVKPTAANRSRKRCARFVGAGRLSRAAKRGRNRLRFQGRLNRRRSLKPGRYRVVVGARDAAGNAAKPRVGPIFTIVRK